MRPLLLATALLACSEQLPDAPVVDSRLRDLAGTYVRGANMTWTETLTIDADGRFERSSRGCMGATRYTGSTSLEGDRVILHGLPDDPQKVAEIERFDVNRLRIVTWGERVYLIEDMLMADFCNSVNASLEPRASPHGHALLREGDWLRPALSLPIVPAEWSELLLHADLAGTVIALDADTAWVDFGSSDGLRKGMDLLARDVRTPELFIARGAPPTRHVSLHVLELESDRCRVRRRYPGTGLEVGMRVTSRTVDRD